MTRNQIITEGMGQVIDINILAVMGVMDLFKVRDQKTCLLKVHKAFHHFKPEVKSENF